MQSILKGKSSSVAAGMRRSATLRKLTPGERKPVDYCARYLLNNAKDLKYDDYLIAGLPIATGVIEGSFRHLIIDRMTFMKSLKLRCIFRYICGFRCRCRCIFRYM